MAHRPKLHPLPTTTHQTLDGHPRRRLWTSTITLDIARLIPSGHITGIEYTSTPLESARALASSHGITNADFQLGDVHELKFPDDSFDIVYAHQVLQHVRDPIQALRKMKRVAGRA